MPRDGSLTLSDIREPTLVIGCERCGRHGRYNVARLAAAHGADAKLPDFLATLANCDKARSFGVHDRCKAKFEGFSFELNPSSTVTAPRPPRRIAAFEGLAQRLEAMAEAKRPWWRRLVG